MKEQNENQAVVELASIIALRTVHSLMECIPFAATVIHEGYRKQKEGVWIKDEESKFEHRYHCSVCNFYLIGEPKKHCEDCGAKMKGGAE